MKLGDTAILSCTAYGITGTTISWKKDGLGWPAGEPESGITFDENTYSISSRIVLQTVVDADNAEYQCIHSGVNTDSTTVEATIVLDVFGW